MFELASDSQDRIKQRLNMMLFGPSPSEEVTAGDAWDFLTTNHPQAPGRHYSRGEGVRVHRNHITIRHEEHEWITDVEAVEQLRTLMAQWRADGKTALVHAVETREESDGDETTQTSIYEDLGRTRTITTHIRIPIASVKFYRELPHHSRGLQELVNEPRSFARIVGLETPPE